MVMTKNIYSILANMYIDNIKIKIKKVKIWIEILKILNSNLF